MITRTWYDPCPRCHGEVTGVSADVDYITDNPDSVISIHDPECPYDDADPDSPDCTCIAVPNPALNPALDRHIPVGVIFTMQPCGDVIRAPTGRDGKMAGEMAGEMAGWKMYQMDVPEPGSLGELMRDWAQAAEDD